MNVNFKFRYIIPSFFIILALTVCFNIFLQRLQYDDFRQNVQFSIHENDINYLIELSGHDQSTVLSTLKNQVGISSVVVSEPTIDVFQNQAKLTVLPGNEIINMLRVGQLYRTVLSRLRAKTKNKSQCNIYYC